MAKKFRVVRPWFGVLQKYTNQIGELMSVQKSSLDPKYDGLTLKMPDGEYKLFSRNELSEVERYEVVKVDDEHLVRNVGLVGDLVKVIPAKRGSEYDALILAFPNGATRAFFRHEVRRLQNGGETQPEGLPEGIMDNDVGVDRG